MAAYLKKVGFELASNYEITPANLSFSPMTWITVAVIQLSDGKTMLKKVRWNSRDEHFEIRDVTKAEMKAFRLGHIGASHRRATWEKSRSAGRKLG